MLRKRDDFSKRYNKLKKDLRNEIVSGNIQPGEYILPENTLSEKYNLSRVSARKVLAELVEEGMIEKIPGKGNRVTIPEGCQPVETLRLAWFSHSYEIEIVKKIIELYESSHPYVKIELLALPAGVDYMANVIQMIERGVGPDVFMMSEWHFRQLLMFQKENLILPYSSPGLHPERNSYAKVFDLFSLENQVFATPFIFSPVIICVNEQMLKDAGIHELAITDWDELLAVAKQCTVKLNEDGTFGQYGFCISSSQNRWPLFMLQNDGKIKTDDGKTIFANEETIEALEFCVDLMYTHKVSPIYSHGSEYLAESLFAKERVAMVLTTYYFMNEFRGKSLTWNVEPIQNKNDGTLLLGGGLAINSNSEKVEIAQSFIDFMVSEQAQTLIKQNGCTIPALRTVAEDDTLLDFSIHPRNYNVFIDMMPHTKTLRDLHLTQDEINLIQNELHLLWANMEKPREACTRIEQLMNQRSEERLAASHK